MTMIRFLAALALWGVVLLAGSLAYIASVRECAFDNRVLWALPVCLGAMVLGLLAAGLPARRERRALAGGPRAWPRIDVDRYGLILLLTFLAVLGMSHVKPDFTLETIKKEVPPVLFWLYPAISFLAPLLVRRTAARLDAAEQALLIALGATLQSGAVFFVPPHLALGLSLVAGLQALKSDIRGFRFGLIPALVLVAFVLFLVAAGRSRNPFLTEPALAWLASAAALGLVIALRPRDGAGWVRLLAVPVAVAVIVALSDIVIRLELANLIALQSALDTRLVLFRQHPNYLAPFFAFHAILALGLGLSRPRYLAPAGTAAGLLVYACWYTDSNTGILALAVGLAAFPTVYGLRLAWRRFGGRRVAMSLVVLLLLGGLGGFALLRSAAGVRLLARNVDRFERSIEYRADAWINSLKVIRQFPWLGIGPRNFIAVERFKPGSRFANEALAPHPHNLFLYVAQSAGVFTLALIVLWIALLLVRYFLIAMRPRGTIPVPLAAALLCGGIALLVAGQFDLGMALDSVVPLPFFVMTGLLLTLGTEHRPAANPAQRIGLAVLFAVPLLPHVVGPLRAEILVKQGQVLAFEHEFQANPEQVLTEAKEMLERAIEIFPNVEEAHNVLARLYDTDPRAEQVLEEFIAVAPDLPLAHADLGTYYQQGGRYALAARSFRNATEAKGGGGQLNVHRAREILCLAAVGELEEAQERLEEALRLDRGVISFIPWQVEADGRWIVPVAAAPAGAGADPLPEPVASDPDGAVGEPDGAVSEPAPEPPAARELSLLKAIDTVYERNRADQEAGREVGRRFWMDTLYLVRMTGQLDRASEIIDYMQQNVAEIDPATIAHERALVADEAGDLDAAEAQFERAYQLSGDYSHMLRAQQIMRQRGATGRAKALSADSSDVSWIGDMMVMAEKYSIALEEQADALALRGRLAEAATELRRSMLFEDDFLARTYDLLAIGGLLFRAGDEEGAYDALLAALGLICARPPQGETYFNDLKTSPPARIAREIVELWKARGLTTEEMLEEAKGLPQALSSHVYPSHFRIGLYYYLGRSDLVLRESELLLRHVPDSLLAKRMRLLALSLLGRHRELRAARRSLELEEFARGGGSRIR